MKNRRANFLNFAVIASLLVIIPAFFSLMLILHVFDGQQAMAKQSATLEIEEQARDFLANLNPESIYAPALRRLGRRLLPLTAAVSTSAGNDPALVSIREAVESFFSETKQRCKIYLFNRHGNYIEAGLAPAIDAPALQYIWDCAVVREINNDYTGRKADVSALFGRNFSVSRVSSSNDLCFPTHNYGKEGLFYQYHEAPGRHGIIAFIELADDLTEPLINRLRRQAGSDQALILRNRAGRIFYGGEYAADPKDLFASAARNSPGEPFYAEERLWKQYAARDFEMLFGKSFSTAFFTGAKQLVSGIFLLMIMAGLGFLRRITAGAGVVRLSIRYKLVIIFLFAVYLPVLGLLTLGYNGLRDHRTVLENEARKGIVDLLMEVDSGFAQKEREISATFARFFQDRSWHHRLSGDWKEADTAIRKSVGIGKHGENFFNWLEIRDIRQNQLFSTSTGEANDRVKAMGRSMSLICLEKVMPERLQKAGVKLKQSDLVLISLLENPVIGFSHLFEQPGRMVEMEFEGSNIYWYWNYYQDEQTPVAYVGGNSKVQFNALDYLGKALKKRFSLGNIAIRLIAHLPASQMWIPDAVTGEDDLQNLFKLSSLNDKIETSQLQYSGQRYIAACMPGIKLKDFFIASLFPTAEIDARISEMWFPINLGVAFILLMAILTGVFLSKAFLQPVSELNQGLKELRKRNTAFRVKINNHDELGELGITFNEMMAEVEEMLIAGAIQQCLIPAVCPSIEGYDGLIFNRMATDVGGDYADVFSLPGNRCLIVIGDVTGHGASSAILTAMVKASVFRFVVHDTSLPVMMRRLSEMVFELLRRRKLMTFCAMLLDCSSGRFALSNAGHPFPLICDAAGQIREIAQEALPLGVSLKRSHYEVIEGSLAPDDLLLFYTDGIVEGTDPAGQEFGLKNVEGILRQNCSKSLAEVKEHLLSSFLRHYQREELDDDLTLIMLRRRAAGAGSPE